MADTQTAPTVTAAALCDSSAQYRSPVCPEQNLKALMVYAKILECYACGGTDYRDATYGKYADLVAAAKTLTRGTDQNSRDAMRLKIRLTAAADSGSTTNDPTVVTDLEDLYAAAKSLLAYDPETLDQMDLVLTAKLGGHKNYT